MGIRSEENRRPRFINFVGSFREPGSNAALTDRMLGGQWGYKYLQHALKLGEPEWGLQCMWACLAPPGTPGTKYGVQLCTARSITCGSTAGSKPPPNGGGREGACELAGPSCQACLHCALVALRTAC